MATKSSWADESEDLLDNTPAPQQQQQQQQQARSQSSFSSSSSSSSSSYSSQRQHNNNYHDSTGRDRERTSNNYYNNRDKQDYNSRESHPSHYNTSKTSSTEDYNSTRGSRGDYNNSRGSESRFEYQSRGDYNRDREDRGGYSSQRRNNDDNRNYRNNNSNSINGGAPREPIPLPESAPFIAFVGNLSYNSSKEDIQAFFEEHGCKSINVRLLINKDTGRPKGFGYVEFEDLETLKKAIDLSGQVLQERPIKVDASKPDDGKRREYNKPRTIEPSSETTEATETTETSERKKLVLNPRGTTTPAESQEAYKGPENPFGHAKPRDENQMLSKIEEHRKQRGGSAEPEPVSPAKKEDKPRPQRESRDYHDKSKRDNRGRDDRFKKDDKSRRDDRSNNKEDRPRIKREEKVNEPSQVKNQNPFAALREEDE